MLLNALLIIPIYIGGYLLMRVWWFFERRGNDRLFKRYLAELARRP